MTKAHSVLTNLSVRTLPLDRTARYFFGSLAFDSVYDKAKVIKKANIRNRTNQVPRLTQDTIWESDKTQENITHKRAKRSAVTQQHNKPCVTSIGQTSVTQIRLNILVVLVDFLLRWFIMFLVIWKIVWKKSLKL